MDFLTHKIRTKSDVAGGRASHQPHIQGHAKPSAARSLPASPLRYCCCCCRPVTGRFQAHCLLLVPWHFRANACPGVSGPGVCFQNIPIHVLRLRSYHRLWKPSSPLVWVWTTLHVFSALLSWSLVAEHDGQKTPLSTWPCRRAPAEDHTQALCLHFSLCSTVPCRCAVSHIVTTSLNWPLTALPSLKCRA